MPASPSADVILWETSETLIVTALVEERAVRPTFNKRVTPLPGPLACGSFWKSERTKSHASWGARDDLAQFLSGSSKP